MYGWGERLRFLMKENLPGSYPYTGGVFPYRREGEDPTRMFAGEGSPERTNRRFHYLSQGQPAARLSTAFDSVTLYGEDPDERPDIYGKVGNSGVSIATLDDAKKLYSGFDLCSPTTSVSMTINGPAPIILAFFMNAAIDQQVEKHLKESGQLGGDRDASSTSSSAASRAPATRASCRPATTASASACSACPAPTWSTPRPTRGSATRPCARSAAPSRPTSSRRTRRRTPASSRPSSR